jgi:hypothetical protein
MNKSKLKILKNIIIILILSVNRILFSRQYFSPLPYGYGWAYEGTVWNSDILKTYLNDKEKNYSFLPSLTIYSRSANKAFGLCSSTDNYNLSTIFHGSDSFLLKDLFTDGIIGNPDFSLLTNINNVNINPRYNYNENGCVLGLTILKDALVCDKNLSIRFDAHLPIKKINVINENGFEALQLNSLNIPAEISDSWFSIKQEDENEVFAARLDKLYQIGLISVQNQNFNDFVINNNLLVTQQNDSDPTNGIISTNDITTGNAIYNNGALNIGVISSVGTNTFAIGSSPTIGSVSKIISGLGLNEGIVPLESFALSNSQPFISSPNLSLTVSPNPYFQIISEDLFYSLVPTTTPGIPPINSSQTMESGIGLNIISYKDADDNGNISNISLCTPPVIIQYSNKGLPKEYAQQLSFSQYSSQLSDGTIPDYNENINTLNPDGTLKNLNNTLDNSGPAIIWYKNDYSTLFPLKNNNGNLYLTSSLDSEGNTTIESKIILDNLKNYQQNVIEDNSNSILSVAQQLIQGWFAKGINPGSILEKPSFLYGWNNYSKEGLGDLDLQLAIGSKWFCDKLQGDILLGIIFPTASIEDQFGNYLSMPLGNNKHYELRLGAQSGYNLNNWIRWQGYTHLSWALPSYEQILAPFINTKNFGLQPICNVAKISWKQFIASTDISFFANETTGISFKYQYLLKTKDSINLCQNKGYDGTFEPAIFSAVNLLPYTSRRSHKLELVGSFAPAKDLYIEIGLSNIVAGKNMPKENDFFINLIFSY